MDTTIHPMFQLVAAVPSDYLTTDGLVVRHHRGDADNLLLDNSKYHGVCVLPSKS